MTFDTRARQAVQGIHRAVEVMEMSSTKTRQRLTRFDQYQDRKARNKRIAALAVGIVVSVLLVGAVLVLRSERRPRVSVTTPSMSVTPTSVTGRSNAFKAPFTYTLPPSWTVRGDDPRYFGLRTSDAPSADFYIFRNVRATRLDCTDRPKRGVGSSSEAMTRWFSRHPALDATKPREVTIGGAAGSWVEFKLAARWDQTCPNGLGLITAHPNGPQTWAIYGDEKMRFYVLDLPAGGTVTIVISVPHKSDFKHVIHQAAPIVQSFDFLK
jgi:tetrahydromethanopterin S-methyltransferase subunit F